MNKTSFSIQKWGERLLIFSCKHKNGFSPILVRDFGSVMDVRHLQFQNAAPPIVFSPSGSVMEVRLLHISNALSQMTVTILGTTYDSILSPYGALSSLFLSELNFTPYSSV